MTALRKICITGVSRGLGLALTQAFIRAGHSVAGCARDPRSLQQLRGQFPLPHRFDVVDVADSAAVDCWAKALITDFGIPDIIINNAAIIHSPAPAWQVSADEFDRLFAINVSGTMNVIRAFLPHLIPLNHGIIVNMSSGAGRMGLPHIAPYCATKWAIEGLSKSIATELPDGMAIIPLSPGMVDTDMLRICYPEDAAVQPDPASWARHAACFILGLQPSDSGKSLATP